MNEILFLIINFLIGFLSDIVLNILSKYDIKLLKTLKPYFSNKSVFKAGLYAGITVIIIVGIIMSIFKITYSKYLPETVNEHLIYLLITFVIGYLADIIIYKINIFPKLRLYYQKVGQGLWGALAILFSVIISLICLYLYNTIDIWIPKLKTNSPIWNLK